MAVILVTRGRGGSCTLESPYEERAGKIEGGAALER